MSWERILKAQPTMKPVDEKEARMDENYFPTKSVVGKKITKTFNCYDKKWGTPKSAFVLPFEVEIDLEGITRDQMYNLISRPLIIDLQQTIRKIESFDFVRELSKNVIKRNFIEMNLPFQAPEKLPKEIERDARNMSKDER